MNDVTDCPLLVFALSLCVLWLRARPGCSTTRALFLVAILTGCAGLGADNVIVAIQSNYITFEHPFTDAAAEDVRKRAGRLCEQRKQAAIRTESACSLSKCTTHYQCVDATEAAKYGK
jgi:hypothetical protein